MNFRTFDICKNKAKCTNYYNNTGYVHIPGVLRPEALVDQCSFFTYTRLTRMRVDA